MKRIINLKFKFSLSANVHKKLVNISAKNIRSTAGIRETGSGPKEKIEIEDVVGKRVGKVGVVELNKEHKSNILTESFMTDIRRSLEAMEIDEDMRVVMMRSKHFETFSMGTDLNYLYYKKMNGEYDKIDKYLENLYNFNHFISVYHKPLLGLCTGQAKGSGVSFLSSCSFPMSTETTEASFPETGFGYTPDGGSIFFLSRLEGEIGTFLALTGFPVANWDLVKLGLTKSFTFPYLEEALSTATIGRNFFESMHEYTEKWEESFNNNQNQKNKSNFNNMSSHLSRDELKKMNLLGNTDPFKYPWERQHEENQNNIMPTPFHSMIEREIKTDRQINFKDSKGRYFNNTYANFMSLVYNKLPLMGQTYFSLVHVVKDINRLFRFNTVKEIYEALKEENTYFSEMCLEFLDKKSPLSLEVTLRLLRNARKMNYTEIIKQEINVAKNMIMKNKDFDSFMKNKIAHSKKENIKFSKNLSQITTDDVDEMFQDSKILSNVKLDVKDNSLLPHNRYYDKYPDCFRLWFNENPRAHGNIRENFDYEIKHFMIEKFGIDLRDSNVTLDEVRRIITKIETNQHTRNKNNEKLSNFLSDPKFLNEYFTKRHEVISKYQDNKESLKEIVSTKMKKLYEDNLTGMSKNIFNRCRDIREIEKRRTYLRLKRWLFMNRIMEYKTRRNIINSQRVEALGSKSFFIPEDCNVSYRDVVDPNLKNSPFYKLVGLFSVKTISPEYALKFSTTNPNKEIFSHLEINQEKLNEIKAQLKENPKMFLEVWDSIYDKEAELEFNELEEKSFREYEKIYRMRHEGHSTLDKLPYYKEYQEMKSKWLEVKNKTTEILKSFTHDLITEIIEKEKMFDKSLKEFGKDSKAELEKFEDLKALYNIVHENKSEIDEYEVSNSKGLQTNEERLSIIKQNINNSINNDPFYQNLVQLIKDAESSQNVEMKEFLNNFNTKVMELTSNLVMKSLLDNVDPKSSQGLNPNNVESTLSKLFNISNTGNSSNFDSDFINWLYLKYGTQNIFSEILKNSKFSIISLLKNQIENELFNHNNFLLSKIKDNKINFVRAIYNKEKSLLEGALKNYFETKLSLLNIDIIEKKDLISKQELKGSITMDYVIDTLKEISFCQLLVNNSETISQSLNSVLSNLNISHKEKTIVDLYVNVQELLALNESNDELAKNIKNLFNFVTKEMKNSEWFEKLSKYSNVSETNENVNIDEKIENFMKKRFNEIVYSSKDSSVDYYIDMRKIQDMLKEKFEIFNLNQLVKDYRNDKISLNEENYTPGIFSDPKLLHEKKDLYIQKLKLTEKLKQIESQFNLDNLKKKYSDYLFNADFYIHKILCNVKITEEIFTEKMDNSQNYGKFLFEIKRNLDETYFDLSRESEKLQSVKSFNYMTRLKSILFHQKEYLENLEHLNRFIENKSKFNNLIENEFLDKLDFVAKYEVKILLNEIQADSEKLYYYLVSEFDSKKKITIDRKDFLINNEEFYKKFAKVNLDELIGVEGTNLEYLNELNMRIKEIVRNQLADINENQATNIKKVPEISDDKPSKENKFNDFSAKISSTIKGLKVIQSIKRLNNTSSNQSADFKEMIKNIENPGINFSRIMESLLGRKLSLQELIIDDRQKTLHDYLQDTNFDSVFSKKIPADLLKCAVQVFDARMIKALKLILSTELQKEFSLNNYIQHTLNNNYLSYKPGSFNDDDLVVFSELFGDLEDYRINYNNFKKELEGEEIAEFEKMLETNNQNAENMEKFLEEFKEIALLDSKGHKILIKYKKGSLLNNVINIYKLEPEKKREISDKILKKLQEIVPFPDLSSNYTLLKYVYDYHIGNLQTFYETNRNEAEARLVNLNNILFLEKIERMEKYDPLLVELYPEKNFFNPNHINNEENPNKEFNPEKSKINFEQDTSVTQNSNEHIPAYNKTNQHLYSNKTEQDKQIIDFSRNLAFKIFVTHRPSDWKMALEDVVDPRIKNILSAELDYYFNIYNNMKLYHKGEKEKVFQERKASAMLLTEEFRANQENVRSNNEIMRKNEFNLNDKEKIGFNHLIENQSKNRESEYYKIIDELFGEYLKNKKEKLSYTKDIIKQQKEKIATMENVRVLNPWELISNSQEAYIDMKSGKINDQKFKISIQTYLKWNNINKEYAVFNTTDLTDIVDLDNATSRALYGNYASIPSKLVDLAHEEPDAEFKDSVHILDKSEEKWFEDQIEEILSDFLSHRSQVEKYLTRDQLKALDEDLLNNFTHENFINRVKQNLNRERLSMNYMNDVLEYIKNSGSDQERQKMKLKNNQYNLNKNIKDENAHYMNLAYQLRNDKEYNDKIEEDIRKKKKLGRSLKPDKNIAHPLAEDEGWKSLYFMDLFKAQLFNKSRVEDKEKNIQRLKGNEVKGLEKSETYIGVTPNQKLNHMKTIVEQYPNNSERINGMYRRKTNEILNIMKEKSERLEKLNKFNEYLSSNKVGNLH